MKPSSLRKSQQALSMRESVQYTQQLSELVRSVTSRADDTLQLLAAMDKVGRRLKCPSVLAEKLLADAELREDWRIAREDSILITLNAVAVGTQSQRHYLEQSARKMLAMLLGFASEPSAHELNCSEMHVDNVMSNKVSPQSTIIEVDSSGKRTVSVLNGVPEAEGWKKHMRKEAKIVEACLYGESVSPSLALSTCVRFSRKLFAEEAEAFRECGEPAETKAPAAPLMRKAVSLALAPLPKPTVVTHRSVIRVPTSCCDWKVKMLEMLMDQNKDAVRAVSGFLSRTREAKPAAFAPESKGPNTDRAKMYELHGAVSPYGEPAPRSTARLQRLETVHSGFFSRGEDLPSRVQFVHSALVIQRYLRHRKAALSQKSAVRIQAWFRMVKARKELVTLKIRVFRLGYYRERLRHWFKLLAGRWRMRKSQWRPLGDYSHLLREILAVQSLVRRFLVRLSLPLRRSERVIRQKRFAAIHKMQKISAWQRCRALEGEVLQSAVDVDQQLAHLVQAKKAKSSKDLAAYLRSIQRAEAKDRKMQLWRVAEQRIQAMKL